MRINFSVSVSEENYQKIKILMAGLELTRNEILTRALEKFYDENKNKTKDGPEIKTKHKKKETKNEG